MKTVMTNGRFILLHSGHFNLLSYCRTLAGFDGTVIVAIDSDSRILMAGGNPIFNLMERMEQIKMLRVFGRPLVDQVFPFAEDHTLELIIKTFKPDVLVKGDEWKGKQIIGSNLTTIEFYPSGENKLSSSNIIKTIQNSKQ